jgi:hypothetical protein
MIPAASEAGIGNDRREKTSGEFVMLFLAESHNTGDITQYLEAETVRIGELMRAGIVETVLLKADQSGAFLLVRTADLASARDAVESLPLAAHGLTSVEFTGVIAIDSIPGDPVPQSAS